MSTTQSPEDIRRDIEHTRSELASDVDTLHEKVSPSAIAQRRTEAVKGRLSSVKEKVMGTASSAGDSTSSGMQSVAGTARSAPRSVKQQAQGNPFAAGMIAFGAGWLVSSLLPASEKEKQTAMQAKDKVSEHSDTLTAPLKEAAQSAKENLQPHAQQAAESVKSTATDAAQNVKGEAQSAKDDLSSSGSGERF
jgi:ElaB/YqjD/DUF883 family membrane-anchored ribosome-binding protein